MGFVHQEEQPNPSKRCKFLTSTLKDAFSNCRTFRARLSTSNPDEEERVSNADEAEELFVAAVISKYMESKTRHKTTLTTDSFCWAFSPTTGDLFISQKAIEKKGKEDEEMEDFFSVGSHLSRCSSAKSIEAFASAKTSLSHCSSMNGLSFLDSRGRSIILEFRHCEGWPFGLCRKLLLLPPLPKSPSDSWCWRKSASARITKIP